MANRRQEAVRITTAASDPGEELGRRQRRYVLSMTIRLACFLAAAAFAPGWPMWVFLAGAIFLPYVAVVGANAKDTRKDHFELDVARPQWELPGSARTPLPPGDVVPGEHDGPDPDHGTRSGRDDA